MKKITTFILFIVFVNHSYAQDIQSKGITDLALIVGREGTNMGALSSSEKLLLSQPLNLPYSFPNSSNTANGRYGDNNKRINHLIGMQAGIIVRNKPKSQSYNKLRLGFCLGSYKISSIGGVSNLISHRVDTAFSSVDSSLIYIDSNRVHNINLAQNGMNIRFAVDYLVYLKTRSRLCGYIGLGTAFNQSFTNNLRAQYYSSSTVGSNPYNPDGPIFRGDLNQVTSEADYELKSNAQLKLNLILGVQSQISKSGRMSIYLEFQPGFSSNFQRDYKSSMGTNWISQVGILYSFKKNKLKDSTNI